MTENSVIDNQSEAENTAKISVFSAVTNAFCGRYVLILLVAVIFSFAAVMLGSEDYGCLTDCAAALLTVLILGAAQRITLCKMDIDDNMRKKNDKALDARLTASLGDISGVGSTLGTVAAVAYAVCMIYIADGGIFSKDDFIFPLLSVLATAVALGAAIAAITSKQSMRCSIYIITGKTFDVKGRELIKHSCRVTHNEAVMKYLRNMAAVRMTASISVSFIVIMCAVSGCGSAYSAFHTALFGLAAILLTELPAKKISEKNTEEKLSLWTKKHRSITAVNVMFFLIISFLFIYSFPTQSVFSEYQHKTELRYDYYDQVDNSIKPFSLPTELDNMETLFTGLFIISVMMMIAVSAASITEKSDVENRFADIKKYFACLVTLLVTAVIITAEGFVFPNGSLNLIQWIVSLAIMCLILTVNIIRGLPSLKK